MQLVRQSDTLGPIVGGDLSALISALQAADVAERLKHTSAA